MNKIPSVFLRDYTITAVMTRKVNPLAQWVLDGEGIMTRKYDGTCVMFDGLSWWARREVKEGKTPPANFRPVEHDDVTGKVMGWEPIKQSGFNKAFEEALIESRMPYVVGTYELCGPKVGGNPEKFLSHILIGHADAETLPPITHYDYDRIKDLVLMAGGAGWEGIVWHHTDGVRMAKMKVRDYEKEA